MGVGKKGEGGGGEQRSERGADHGKATRTRPFSLKFWYSVTKSCRHHNSLTQSAEMTSRALSVGGHYGDSAGYQHGR